MLKEEFDTLVPAAGWNRSDFVRSSVGSGFAAAVLPGMAQTVVKTDSTGLVVGEVTIPVGDFKMPAYRAAPANRNNAPVVLVVSESRMRSTPTTGRATARRRPKTAGSVRSPGLRPTALPDRAAGGLTGLLA